MIGIIGGSGLEDPKLLSDAKEVVIESKYGVHSPIVTGKINGVDVAIMSRHGYKHEFTPCTIPYRANINALKEIGVHAIIATSACGSLREEIIPASFSFPTQFIDRTTKREQSFSDHGNVIHESMAQPFDENLRNILTQKCAELGFEYSADTTIVTIEGPRFSTLAESELFRSQHCDLINMTTVPEVCLAKEKHIPYQVINLVTDYDCWKEETKPVTFEEVMRIMKKNADKVKELIKASLPEIEESFK